MPGVLNVTIDELTGDPETLRAWFEQMAESGIVNVTVRRIVLTPASETPASTT
jgi:hypothetical protein